MLETYRRIGDNCYGTLNKNILSSIAETFNKHDIYELYYSIKTKC